MNEVSIFTPKMLELPGSKAPETKNAAGQEFGEAFKDAFDEANKLQKAADQAAESYLSGETDNLHQVMLAAEKADLALQLTVQMRNKIVEAYQEISRMRI